MKLTGLALRRPVTTAMFFVCVTAIGLIGGSRLPLESLPDIEFPFLLVNVPYRNSTPEEVERRITRPIEEALATLPGIREMESTSGDDGAEIELQFEWGSELAAKGAEVRDKIDAIRSSLPDELERITVHKFSGSDQPMLVYRISAERDLSSAYDMLERNLKRRVERLPGVSRVELYGVEPKEVRIELSAERVAAHGVDLRQLAQTLQRANFALSAGDLVEAGKRYYVKPEGRFETLADIGAMVISAQGLRLRDIAELAYAEPILLYGRHLNQRYAVGLNVFKETGANLVEVSDRVKAEIELVKALPEMQGIALIMFNDAATDVRSSLRELLEAGLLGALFSVLVLFLFLHDLRMTLIVILAVPLSLVMTLAAMYFLGFSLNILTLMGLMLSVGMLVDNSVVVTESIFKERSLSNDPVAGTLSGVSKVGLAVTLGTLTTSIVFLPNIFGVQNEMTVFMSHVAVTICVSLAASLLVAITLIPQLTTRLSLAAGGGARWIRVLSERYAGWLTWTLRHRKLTSLFIVAVLASVAIPAMFVKADLFPSTSPTRIFMEYNLKSIYQLDKVEEAVDTIEHFLVANKDRFEIESVYSYFDLSQAQTLIYLHADEAKRTRTAEQIKEDIRKELPKLAIGEPSFEQNRSGGEKLSVQIYGESSDRLREVATDTVQVLKSVKGLTDVRLDAGAEGWEVRVRVDRIRARAQGLSSQDVAETVAAAMRGTQLKPFRTSTGEVDLLLQFRPEDRTDLDALMSLPIQSADGRRVTLGTVADLSIGEVPSQIQRENRRTAMAINFGTAEGVTPEDAKKQVDAVLDAMAFPAGYGWGYGQAFDDEAESMNVMLTNMLLALACIYIVMAALFESVLAPTAIITGIIFSFIGVYWFFFITGTTFSFMAMIGMLVLMGVVVNNGIVLIDHVHQLREAGMARERALIEGSRDRLRPILMTAASTILAMIPIALSETAVGGDGPPYYPMARAVIGGLAFATVVSLLVLPTLYLAIEDLGNWGTRQMRKARGTPLAASTAEP
ncbi:MAG: efflux RND transporter permease subunit [Pseudomonadota bacterium]|nr:efflux RND transporter permease subunit [Pseudomonadota bacterium]